MGPDARRAGSASWTSALTRDECAATHMKAKTIKAWAIKTKRGAILPAWVHRLRGAMEFQVRDGVFRGAGFKVVRVEIREVRR